MSGEKDKSLGRRLTSTIRRLVSTRSSRTAAAGPSAPATAAAAGSSQATAPAATEPAPKPAQAPVDQPAPRTTTTAPRTTAAPRTTTTPRTTVAPRTTTASRSTTAPPPPMSAEQRARALFKKHGLDINPGEWNFSRTPQGERVQKDIRMRVHRTCHKCETSYGPDKTCVKCAHKRCKKCPRHPVKKERKQEKKPGDVTNAPGYKRRKGDVVYGLTIPSRRTGQPLVHKAVRLRVHRKCHRCEKDFAGGKVCNNCKHTRCKRCPREPPKGSHPPEYYTRNDPDDSEPEVPFRPRRTYKRPRRRVHWTCEKCSTTFIEKTKTCAGCGSSRDETGVRDPPKKPRFRPSEEDMQRLNDRLRQTSLGTA